MRQNEFGPLLGPERRVAIITSETPNSLYAGSMQLLRVFGGYPADKLAVLGPPVPSGAKTLACAYYELTFPVMRWRNTRLHRAAMSLVVANRWWRKTPQQIGSMLRNFQPDAVFTVMDNFSHYYSAYEYAKSAGLPLLTVTMDEPDFFEKVFRVVRPWQQRGIARVYRYAERNLCVSRQMTSHIASTYRCATETFYFGPPDGVVPRPSAQAAVLRRAGNLVLGFAGSLSYGYGESLQRLCLALQETAVKVRIYSRDKPWWSAPNMEYAGCLPSEELWQKFKQECDASLLVYTFHRAASSLYRTHFPTKLSEYAWLGMPMVMVGPAYATGIVWGLEHADAALVETDSSLAGLARRLEELAASGAARETMARAAADAAKREFDPLTIKRAFHRVLAAGAPDRDTQQVSVP